MADSTDMTVTDFRCSVHPARLFARLRQEGEHPPIVEGNLVEFSCRECTKVQRQIDSDTVLRVLHRYNLIGELIETVVVRRA